MVKIRFSDRSQYDDTNKEILIDANLLNDKERLSQALEHEVEHYIIDNRVGNIIYDLVVDNAFKWWKVPFIIGLVALMCYFQFVYLPATAYEVCKVAYNDLALKCANMIPTDLWLNVSNLTIKRV